MMGGVGLALLTAGLLLVGVLGVHAAWWDVVWRLALARAEFALFQAPNNRLLMSSVPRERSGAGSGMLSTARLLGQAMGAAIAAICFAQAEARGVAAGATAAVFTGAAFAALATVFSCLRLGR